MASFIDVNMFRAKNVLLVCVEGHKLHDPSSSFHADRSLSGDGNSRLFPGKGAFGGLFSLRLRAGKGFEVDFISKDHAE